MKNSSKRPPTARPIKNGNHSKYANILLCVQRRMLKFFETKQFHFFFSFIIGVAIMSLFRPLCKGNECRIIKAPPPQEVEKTTYKIGSKCFQFKTYSTDCPSEGVIEPFEMRRW